MTQINLLPDIKMQYIKAQQIRNIAISVSIVAASISIFVTIILFSAGLAQKHHMNTLQTKITSEIGQLKNKPDISKVLTIQSQLSSVTQLDQAKPDSARLFSTYLNQLTPNSVAISSLTLDLSADTMTIVGTGDSVSDVNQYIDIFKLTTFKTKNVSEGNAFSNIDLSSFGINPNPQTPIEAVGYTLTTSFNPSLFNNTQQDTLDVPAEISTRSVLDAPTLFQTITKTSTIGQEQ
jgi:hypothetical protein